MTSPERKRFFRAAFFSEAEVFFFFRLFIGEIIAHSVLFSENEIGVCPQANKSLRRTHAYPLLAQQPEEALGKKGKEPSFGV